MGQSYSMGKFLDAYEWCGSLMYDNAGFATARSASVECPYDNHVWVSSEHDPGLSA